MQNEGSWHSKRIILSKYGIKEGFQGGIFLATSYLGRQVSWPTAVWRSWHCLPMGKQKFGVIIVLFKKHQVHKNRDLRNTKCIKTEISIIFRRTSPKYSHLIFTNRGDVSAGKILCKKYLMQCESFVNVLAYALI